MQKVRHFSPCMRAVFFTCVYCYSLVVVWLFLFGFIFIWDDGGIGDFWVYLGGVWWKVDDAITSLGRKTRASEGSQDPI